MKLKKLKIKWENIAFLLTFGGFTWVYCKSLPLMRIEDIGTIPFFIVMISIFIKSEIKELREKRRLQTREEANNGRQISNL